ncbi:MAG: hypothetical protein ABSF18_03965 [Gammaproteobacteria bacterium]|jgi:hypothetical protein
MLALSIPMKTKLNILLVASILLFMQFALFQHELSHTFSDHDHHEHEMANDCQLCLGTHALAQYLLPVKINISLSLITVLVLCFYSFVSIHSSTIQLPRNRAPPVTDLFI